jgi:endonuclease/exonuclease/phosphatase (EEP) superfamily protein YafD
VLLTIPAACFLAFAALRLFGVAGNRYIAATIALTPYIAVLGLLIGAVGLLMRRWVIGGLAMALALITAAAVLPRVFTDDQPSAAGPRLSVMSANLFLGQGDARSVVDLVRANRVDVLSLQELSLDAVNALDAAGIDAVLPYRLFRPARDAASGSGLASRYPLQERKLADDATFTQPGATIDLPGVVDVDVLVVHTVPPVIPGYTGRWKQELDRLPAADFQTRPRMLIGDFNATLDHPGLRDLLSRGYVDAGERRGAGLVPTWPAGLWPPPVTIDHVLVDNRTAVNDYRVVDLPGSDHRALLASVTLAT